MRISFPAGMAPKVDLSRFEKSGAIAPGTYRGDVILNRVWRASTDIVLDVAAGGKDVLPCFDKASLTSYGVDLKKSRCRYRASRQKADPRMVASAAR